MNSELLTHQEGWSDAFPCCLTAGSYSSIWLCMAAGLRPSATTEAQDWKGWYGLYIRPPAWQCSERNHILPVRPASKQSLWASTLRCQISLVLTPLCWPSTHILWTRTWAVLVNSHSWVSWFRINLGENSRVGPFWEANPLSTGSGQNFLREKGKNLVL